MNTTQRREAAQYLLKAIAAAASDDNTPAAEALMALYEVLKQPVPPCELPGIVGKSMSQSATESDSNILVRAALEKDAVSVAAAMEHAGASVLAIAPSAEHPGEYLVFARYDPCKTSVDKIDRWIDVTELPVVDEDANPLFFECLGKRYDVSVSKTESAKIYRFEYDSHLWEIKGFKNHVWPRQGYVLANPSDYRIVADGVQKSAVFKFSAGAVVEHMQAIGVPVSNTDQTKVPVKTIFFEFLGESYKVEKKESDSQLEFRFEFMGRNWLITAPQNTLFPSGLRLGHYEFTELKGTVLEKGMFRFNGGGSPIGLEFEAIGAPVPNMEEAEDTPPKPCFEHEGKLYDVEIKETVFNKELRFFWGLHRWKADKPRDFEWPKGNVKLVDYDLRPIPGTVHSQGGFIFDSDDSIGFVEIKAMGTSVAKEPVN